MAERLTFYVSPKGKAVGSFSHSQGTLHAACPTKYVAQRHLGYQDKGRAANMEFGNCVEGGLRSFYTQGEDPSDVFARLWEESLKKKNLEFKDGWQNRDSLLECGRDLLRVFRVSRARFGIRDPRFYTYHEKMQAPLVAGSPYEYVPDIIDWPEEHNRWGTGGRVVDVKCSDSPYRDSPPGIAAMDLQLRLYAHGTGFRRVAFLVFVKGNPASPQRKGSSRTYTGSAVEGLATGDTVKFIDPPGMSGKAADKAKDELKASGRACVEFAGKPYVVQTKDLSPQRIQFIEARVSDTMAASAAEWLKREALQVSENWERYRGEVERLLTPEVVKGLTSEQYDSAVFDIATKEFPPKPGMKFPNDQCGWCEILGLCLKDKKVVEERLVRIQDDWLEGL